MMPLTKRGKKSNGARVRALLNSGRTDADIEMKKGRRSTILNLILKFCIVVVVSMYSLHGGGGGVNGSRTQTAIRRSSTSTSSSSSSSTDGVRYVIDETLGVDLFVDLQTISSSSSSSTTISGGPHRTFLVISSKVGCTAVSDVKFWLQYEGDAMGTVILAAGDTNEWTGDVSFPISGSYQLVSYYAGCGGEMNAKVSRVVLKDGLTVVVDNTNYVESTNVIGSGEDSSSSNIVDPYFTSTLFPKATWVASHKLDSTIDSKTIPYIWHDPSQPGGDVASNFIKTSTVSVSKQGATFKETGFFSFPKLSNYELVCWVGSQSALAAKEAFGKLRPTIASNQRPFKFHYYNTSSFVHPETDWVGDHETRIRKCKHLLVSIDEIKNDLDGSGTNKPLTQQQYADQVTTFLHHLEKAFPDETFPIWIFTLNESPITPTNCVSPYYLPWTSHHPCNDVLFDLFTRTDPTMTTTGTKFSSRVHLLDNTMISLPQSILRSSSTTSSRNDVDLISKDVVATTIALRIYVLVGRKVKEWRDARQIGLIDGLHRGDNVEPNFELVPYTGWK
mmetsp:Transcript_34033/g.81804  ORF Transcript_34033/g.81804 Transcript_34033/m.81804 type:complete len:560 (+) Transcript_34033:97-1776(+)